jgi:Fur family transcriptional regulator, ferric uptake regulator
MPSPASFEERGGCPRSRPGRRWTENQRAVLEALHHSDHFRSAQQLHRDIREHHTTGIGLTSVYRILHRLAAERIAETQRAEDGETLYRLRTEPGHLHHLLCRRCGVAVAFTPVGLETLTARLAHQHRYTDVTHHIDLYGTCPQCIDSTGT